MSTVNATTVYTETVSAGNLVVGNASSNLAWPYALVINSVPDMLPAPNSYIMTNTSIWSNNNGSYYSVAVANDTMTDPFGIVAANNVFQIDELPDGGSIVDHGYMSGPWVPGGSNNYSTEIAYVYMGTPYYDGIILYIYEEDSSFGGAEFAYNGTSFDQGTPGAVGAISNVVSSSSNAGLSPGWTKLTITMYRSDPTINCTMLIFPEFNYIGTTFIGDGRRFFVYRPQMLDGLGGDYIKFGIGANVTVNSTSIMVGNATVNTLINATALTTNSIIINGTTYSNIGSIPTSNYQSFTAPGANVWIKPSWATANDLVTIHIWGGGGGGNTSYGGGGGGACLQATIRAGQCAATCNVYVGSGGKAGYAGQTSFFYANSTAWSDPTNFAIAGYGGGGSTGTMTGAGGGWFGAGLANGQGGPPVGGAKGSGAGSAGGTSTYGGGGGATSTTTAYGGFSVYGGGGGGKSTTPGGNSVWGGGGGGAVDGGYSIFGGKGSNSAAAAAAPGGGGGTSTANTPGARGEIRIWVNRVGS